MIDWTPYLESICTKYAQWWDVYTLTDVEGKTRSPKTAPLLTDLWVQEIKKEREKPEERAEKTERFTVLEGLRKYAPNHILLRGRPGSGKSTALARLLLEEAEKAKTRLNSSNADTPKDAARQTKPALTRLNSSNADTLKGAARQTKPALTRLNSSNADTLKGAARQTKPADAGSMSLAREGGLSSDSPRLQPVGDFPILVELRYYQTSILDLILQFLQRHELIIDSNTLEKLLLGNNNFTPLLLFDGINELPSEAARQDLQKFRQQYQKIQMIFTTRDIGIGGDLNIEKKLEMLALNESQMRDFVKAYLPEKGEKMLKQLGNRLKEFGETPLLLWMLCSVFENNESQIPANLGLVFRRFTEIYDHRLKADVPTYQESRNWWRELLQILAWKMTQGDSKTEILVAIDQREASE